MSQVVDARDPRDVKIADMEKQLEALTHQMRALLASAPSQPEVSLGHMSMVQMQLAGHPLSKLPRDKNGMVIIGG